MVEKRLNPLFSSISINLGAFRYRSRWGHDGIKHQCYLASHALIVMDCRALVAAAKIQGPKHRCRGLKGSALISTDGSEVKAGYNV